MAFTAKADCLFLRKDQVGNQDAVIDLGMTFYAAYILKVQGLIGQPVMRLHDVDLFTFRKEFELGIIPMTGEADGIIIAYGGLQILSIPH
jgi:hypothetical protein